VESDTAVFEEFDGSRIAAVSGLARALTGAASRGQVLDALCNSVRSSLRTQVAYVALNRTHAAEAVVCSSAGVRTRPFRSLRLPHRAGLGGLVASEGVTLATEDYTADRSLTHVEDLDRRVLDEGLRGIVATPLRTGPSVVGAALAGVRDIRRFGPYEAAVLQALSDVAGAALERLALLRDTEQRAEDAERRLAELVKVTQRQREMLEERNPSAVVRERGELVTDLISGACRDEESFRVRAGATGLDPAQSYDVLAAVPNVMSAEPIDPARWPARVAQDGGLATVTDDSVGTMLLALLPAPRSTTARTWLQNFIGPDVTTTAAIAGPAASAAELHEAIRAACRTVRLLLALGKAGKIGNAAKLGPLPMLAAVAAANEIADFLDQALSPLLALEPRKRDRLLATLEAWFDHAGSSKRVARALGVHINTVYSRLEKLDEILGSGWQEGRRRQELETAVRLQLLGAELVR
jgi:sugar diacid utilization regulator